MDAHARQKTEQRTVPRVLAGRQQPAGLRAILRWLIYVDLHPRLFHVSAIVERIDDDRGIAVAVIAREDDVANARGVAARIGRKRGETPEAFAREMVGGGGCVGHEDAQKRPVLAVFINIAVVVSPNARQAAAPHICGDAQADVRGRVVAGIAHILPLAVPRRGGVGLPIRESAQGGIVEAGKRLPQPRGERGDIERGSPLRAQRVQMRGDLWHIQHKNTPHVHIIARAQRAVNAKNPPLAGRMWR